MIYGLWFMRDDCRGEWHSPNKKQIPQTEQIRCGEKIAKCVDC